MQAKSVRKKKSNKKLHECVQAKKLYGQTVGLQIMFCRNIKGNTFL